VDDGLSARLEIGAVAPSDLEPLSHVHLAAFAGNLGASLGRQYVEAMFRWYLSEPGAITLVGRRGDEIAGYVFGAADGHWDRFNRDMVPTVVGSLLRRPGSILHPRFLTKIPLHLRSVFGPRPAEAAVAGDAPVYNLCGIGVAPPHRKQGVAACLIEHFEAQAWAAGFGSIILSVHASNHGARRLYESRSWRMTSDEGDVVRYRITKALQAGQES
jgi:GNAT superfamily N-acetyltransferase